VREFPRGGMGTDLVSQPSAPPIRASSCRFPRRAYPAGDALTDRGQIEEEVTFKFGYVIVNLPTNRTRNPNTMSGLQTKTKRGGYL
jgi:hypothetical protein